MVGGRERSKGVAVWRYIAVRQWSLGWLEDGHADGAEAGEAKTTATATAPRAALFARNGAAVQREVQAAGGRAGQAGGLLMRGWRLRKAKAR